MSDQEPDEAASELTPEMEKLITVLHEKLGRGMITDMQRSHGGVVRTFLRNCAVDYPEVAAALMAVAPVDDARARSEALYAALDYIVDGRH